jgi:hypothetical protein
MGALRSPILSRFWVGPLHWSINPDMPRRPPMHPIHQFYDYLPTKTTRFVNYAVSMKIAPKSR